MLSDLEMLLSLQICIPQSVSYRCQRGNLKREKGEKNQKHRPLCSKNTFPCSMKEALAVRWTWGSGCSQRSRRTSSYLTRLLPGCWLNKWWWNTNKEVNKAGGLISIGNTAGKQNLLLPSSNAQLQPKERSRGRGTKEPWKGAIFKSFFLHSNPSKKTA